MNPTASRWPVAKVRSTFIDYFKSKPSSADGHVFAPSSPCVPHDDPTLLFTNAGMNQFKPIFLGNVAPTSPLFGMKRAVNSQKCIRAGGKHNDLDDVGKDTYHHTFFEMLGNWSFGDYFKKEAVEWSWELLTKVYGLPKEALYASYFGGNKDAGLEPDLETKALWEKFLPPERVIPGNMKDNFWEMGETGPCGPCTEIHVDRLVAMGLEKRLVPQLVNASDPDVIEIWNNVFIQFNREPDGSLRPLPAKHVDTGMGLERITSILQNVRSNYDSDVFTPIFAKLEELLGGAHQYRGRLGAADIGNVDTAFRVIADHIRTLTFAITDGATPSNEGRGYVLRRILRRAVRYGRQVLGAKAGFFAALVPVVVENFGAAFPELKKNPQRVIDIIKDEEESFGKTLDRGLVLFEMACVRVLSEINKSADSQYPIEIVGFVGSGQEAVDVSNLPPNSQLQMKHRRDTAKVIPASDAFKLHDTFGFPIDLTVQMAEERGFKVDIAGYEKLMEQAKDLARSGGGKFGGEADRLNLSAETIARLEKMHVARTDDQEKYTGKRVKATVKAIWNGHNFDEHVRAGSQAHAVGVILDRTSFYAEMGGQEADSGRLSVLRETRSSESHIGGGEFRIEGVKAAGGYVVHIGQVAKGELRVGDDVEVHVDGQRRHGVMAHHTATHLLNLALRDVLGDGVDQKGSLVAEDRLRFDFSHSKAVTPEELAKVEQDVRMRIEQGLAVDIEPAPLAAMKAVNGLRAVFGEVYPDPVRVVSIGAKVKDLLANPTNPAWRSASVEFCGGTHVANTRDIGAFALTVEEAVAKGIRRITALTGVPATAAIKAAESLSHRVHSAARLTGAALTDELTQITAEVDTLPLPAAKKAELRVQIGTLQEKVKQEQRAQAAVREKQTVASAMRIAEDANARTEAVVVATIDAAGDRQALQSAVNAVQQACPRSAVMLVDVLTAEGKVSLIGSVPKPLIDKGLKAGDWVRAVSEVLGGKGGGKPDVAQGGGTDVGKVKDALATARQVALKAIGQ